MAKILVIDDEQDIRSLLSNFLVRKGYAVDTASDGEEGMQLFKKNQYDLVIVDIFMPEKEGIETIREIREENTNIKIMAMSGGGMVEKDEILEIAKAFGANQALSKPFEMSNLLTTVHDLIGNA